MTDPRPSTRLPAKALRQFEKAAGASWQDGVPLAELLERANRVAALFLPEDGGRGSRVRRLFTERSLRHYQTLGCIDAPGREGHRASYSYRHLVQALLVRKLLLERVPSGQVAALMSGRGTEETARMLVGGIEMVARAEDGRGGAASGAPATGVAEPWRRIAVAPGIELHLRGDLPRPRPGEMDRLVESMERALRRSL